MASTCKTDGQQNLNMKNYLEIKCGKETMRHVNQSVNLQDKA